MSKSTDTSEILLHPEGRYYAKVMAFGEWRKTSRQVLTCLPVYIETSWGSLIHYLYIPTDSYPMIDLIKDSLIGRVIRVYVYHSENNGRIFARAKMVP